MAQDIEMLAGEYVLGTLSAAERLAFERDLASRQDLRRAVAEWEKRLAPLNGAGKDVAPPRALWTALEAALPQVAGRPELKLIQGSGGPDKLRAAVAYWKRATLVASALAAMLAVAIVGREIARAPADSYVAVVNRGGDQPALIVRVDVASGTVLVRPVLTETPASKSLELWYIVDGVAPKSMGVVDHAPLKLSVPVSAVSGPAPQLTFAVTVEPVGGSPTGGPTGPVVYSGKLIKE